MLPCPTRRSGVSSVRVYSGISALGDVCTASLDEVTCTSSPTERLFLRYPRPVPQKLLASVRATKHRPFAWILAQTLQVHVLTLGINFSFLGQLCVLATRSDSKPAHSHYTRPH